MREQNAKNNSNNPTKSGVSKRLTQRMQLFTGSAKGEVGFMEFLRS